MFQPIDYEKIEPNSIFIDVRSPEEYHQAHIPGAMNLPVFNNDERAEVGTLYKQVSVDSATRRGVEIMSSKLLDYYDKIVELKRNSKHQRIVFYCSRGGYRSRSIAMLLCGIGVSVNQLRGGYKGYRQYILSKLPEYNEKITYIVIHGHTGTGKTHLLKHLNDNGLNIIDFEHGANHRGSLLGQIGLEKHQSAKAFESYIFHQMHQFCHINCQDNGPIYVFVEAESKRIGNVFIPDYIHKHMQEGIHIDITSDVEFRAENLISDYINDEHFDEEFLQTFERLSRYIKEDKLNEYRALIKNKDYKAVCIDLMLNYYDPMYSNSTQVNDYALELKNAHNKKCADEITQWFNENYAPQQEDDNSEA